MPELPAGGGECGDEEEGGGGGRVQTEEAEIDNWRKKERVEMSGYPFAYRTQGGDGVSNDDHGVNE